MSIQSAIASIFGGSTTNQQQLAPQQQQQAKPTTPGNIPENTTPSDPQLPNTAPNGAIPEQKKDAAPLDEFADLWKNEPTDPNAAPVDNSVFGKVNTEELMKAAGNIDFTKVITPDMMQAIQAGGEEGTKALIQAVNKTQQLGYAQSTHATTILIEQAIAKTKESFLAELPKHIRDKNTSELVKETPAFAHPAAQPLVEALVGRLQVKYPNATSRELTDMANKYVQGFANSVTPKPEVAKVPASEDWSAFLNS